jgi:hypothetical protein
MYANRTKLKSHPIRAHLASCAYYLYQGAFYSALWALAATALLCLGAGATHAHYTVGDEPEGFLLCGAGLSVLLAVHSFVMAITGSYWNSQVFLPRVS